MTNIIDRTVLEDTAWKSVRRCKSYWLDENKICWEDVSEDFGKGIPSEIDYELWICRTHFEVKGHEISVINGYGTYGGYGLFSKDNDGLLETMGLWCGEDSIKGHLTAEEVINKIKALVKYEEK